MSAEPPSLLHYRVKTGKQTDWQFSSLGHAAERDVSERQTTLRYISLSVLVNMITVTKRSLASSSLRSYVRE